jgi:hypothetical protein
VDKLTDTTDRPPELVKKLGGPIVYILALLPAIGELASALVDIPSEVNVDTGFPNPV